MRAPSFATWDAEHRHLILNDRAQGMKMRDLGRKYHHAESTLRDFFESVGTPITPCVLRSLRKPTESKAVMPNSWIPLDAMTFEQKQRVLCDFRPMMTVSIQTGDVLLDRRDEVLPAKQRGGIGGRW